LGSLPDPDPILPDSIAPTIITAIQSTAKPHFSASSASSEKSTNDTVILPEYMRSATISQLSIADSKLELSRPLFNDQGYLVVNPGLASAANIRGGAAAAAALLKPAKSSSTASQNAKLSFNEGQRVEVFLQLVDTQKRAFVREDVKWKVDLRSSRMSSQSSSASVESSLPEIKIRFD
jgi:hypothetical protein